MSKKILPKNILLLSAYDAESHRYWHQQLSTQLKNFEWTVLTLKDRHFAWRMGGNALNFQAAYHAQLQDHYDLVLATSMTDLATLRGLYPHLAQVPHVLYFHENQFAYPPNQQQQGLLEIQLRSVLSAAAADQLWFNSQYNRDTFMAGAAALLNKMPDGVPDDLFEQLHNHTVILPVPIRDDCQPITQAVNHSHHQIVWNHRWEHDKGPEVLLALMRLCEGQRIQGKPIGFHLLGRQFRQQPPALQAILSHHRDACLTVGYVADRTSYLQILQQADVVVSTAYHDFQGIAVLEAAACGCLPVVPDRLVYPELYPASNRYDSTPSAPEAEAQALFELLISGQLQTVEPQWLAAQLLPIYQQQLEVLLSMEHSR